MDRRKFINYAIAVIITGVVVGVGTYFAVPPKEVTKTITETAAAQTVTKTVTITSSVATTPVTTPAVPVIDYKKNIVERLRGKPWEVPEDDYKKYFVAKVSKESYRVGAEKHPPPLQWVPPEGWEEIPKHVKEIRHGNLGSMAGDPAIEISDAAFEYFTGIKVIPIEKGVGEIHPYQITALTAKSPTPEVIAMDRMFVWDFVEKGFLEPLDDIWTDEALDLHVPTLKKALKIKGHIYLAPEMTKFPILFYRKDHFEKYGVDRPPKTWQEIIEIGKQLTIDTNNDGKPDIWGWLHHFAITTPRQTYEALWNYIYPQGGSVMGPDGISSFETEEAKNALKFIYSLANEHKIMPPAVTTITEQQATDVVMGGTAAMYLGWTWHYPRFLRELGEEKIGVAPIPKSGGWEGTPEGQHSGVLDLDAWGVNPFAPKWQKEAAKLYCHMYSSFMCQWFELAVEGNAPTFKEVWERKELAEIPFYKVAVQSVEGRRYLDWQILELVPRAAMVAEAVTPIEGELILGRITPEEASKKMQAEVKKIFG
jgi:multiple sugar transport system substrate-binding protein